MNSSGGKPIGGPVGGGAPKRRSRTSSDRVREHRARQARQKGCWALGVLLFLGTLFVIVLALVVALLARPHLRGNYTYEEKDSSGKVTIRSLTITERTFEQGHSAETYEDLGDNRLRLGEGKRALIFRYEWRGGKLVMTEVTTGITKVLTPKRSR